MKKPSTLPKEIDTALDQIRAGARRLRASTTEVRNRVLTALEAKLDGLQRK